MVQFLNIAGLVLGFVGTLICAFYGMPPDVDRGGLANLAIGNDDEMNQRVRRHRIANRVGLLMLAASFAMQLAAYIA